MTAQRNELVVREFNFTPTTYEEAQKYATIFAKSEYCPQSFKGHPDNILIVWQMGKEIGLDKMQSLRTMGCINGMPFVYGDGLLALVKRHPQFENMREWFEGDMESKNLTAFCMMKRKNQDPAIQSYSIEDAKLAGLWNNKDVWKKYPKRMLQHRARGYCARDAFPDSFFGIMTEDEAYSIANEKVIEAPISKNKGMLGLKETLGINDEPETIIECEVIDHPKDPFEPSKLDELKELINQRNVTYAAITITLKKFGVSSVDDLTDEMIDKWSTHLKSKEIK